jgi:CheY-like chemotaxis protein
MGATGQMGATSTRGAKRVLVVEDELLLGILLEGMLAELGHEVVTIAPRVSAALAAVESETYDLAVLDVRLYGESVDPVAAALVAKAIPFIFATGYGRDGVPEPYRNRLVLQKPFSKADLERAIESLGQGSA